MALLALLALLTVALPRPAAAAERASSAVVLMYHRFGEDKLPSTSIRMAQFRAHLAELRREAYTVLPLERVVRALRAGEALPDRTVALTVDDAYASVYTQAWPLLRDAGLPFTVFVATEPVDRGYPDMMTWGQMREMAASGLVSFGNHTATHAHLADGDLATARRELAEGSERLQAELGVTPTLFAYPYGEESVALRNLVREAGFLAAFGQQSGVAWSGEDFYLMPRFALNEHYGAQDRFTLAVNALPLPVEDLQPSETLVPRLGANPPELRFVVHPEVGDLNRLACYGPNGQVEDLKIREREVRVRLANALGQGRSRLNCTLPAAGGRWRWLGRQFYHPG